MRRLGVSFIATVVILAAPAVGQAGEDYFLLMFGSQRVPSDPRYAHTFATFVRMTWPGDGPPKNVTLDYHTISWLAETMVVRLYTLLPEPGSNLDLPTTLRWCVCNDMRISLWGPYRICPELYFLAQKQVGLLNSGQVRYKAIDTGFPSDQVSNCIHAVSSVVDGYRLRVASPGWGEIASYAVLKRYERYVIDSPQTHAWVGYALGLDEYPIIYRDWQSPASGALGPVYRLFGGERSLRATYGPPGP